MARGKQAHPQHVRSGGSCTEEEQSVDDGDHTSLDTANRHHYCEELGALSDVKPHKRFYSSRPHVLQVLKGRGTSEPTDDYHVHCVSSTTFRELDGCAKTFETGDHIPQGSPGQPEDNMAFENCSRCSSNDRISNSSSTHASSGEQQQTDIPLSTSALAMASLPQSGSFSPPELCQWRNTSVTIENLQSTKVAVAQFSQQTQEDDCHIGTGTTTVSSLLEQILALQVQQSHQLQLTNQICHQVLLFASEKLNISESPVSCDQEPSASKSTAPIIDLSCNLSQQLAIAARTAQCLATQSGNVTEFEKLISTQQHSLGSESFHSDSLLRQLMTLRYQQWFSKAEYAQAGGPNLKCNDVPCAKGPSLAFGKNSLVNKSSNSLHFTQSINQLHINCDPMINIVTSVAEEKNHKSINITLSEPKASLNNGFFKRRCRFCGKLFGSDSALQIHMRSHTGERPYKCNICGNRFSTRGNLKVHFQRHKKRYPHITMNPYPIPQHLDNIPTRTGIPYGMSMLPEKPSTRCIHNKLCVDKTTTSSWIQSLGCIKQPSLVKQEQSFSPSSSCSQNVVHLASNVKTTMPTDSAHTGQGSVITMDCNNEEKASLNVMFEMTTSTQEESKGRVSDDISSSCAHPNSGTAIPFLRSSNTSKLQLLLEDIDKKVSDSYECVLCHRRLSCHSALRTHYRTHITGERPYLCKLCGRAFSSIENLRNHQAVHHAASTWRVPLSCHICQKKFTNDLMLQQHVRLHTGGTTYVAPLLNQNISRPTSCNGGPLNKQHNTHVLLDFSEDSGSSSNFRSSLSSSLSSSVSDVGRCDDHSVVCCGLSQPNWIKKEGEQDPTEEGCPAYNLPTLDNLCPNSKPLCYLTSEGPFQNQVSSTTLKFIEPSIKLSEIDLFNQIKDTPISSPGLYEKGIFKNAACDLCGKSFVCQSALDIHYRTHTKERPFLCTTCNRGFSTKGNLKQHTLTHQMRAILTPSHLFEPSHANKTSPVDDPAVCSMPPLFKREETACPCSPPTSGNHQSKRVAPVLSWSSVGGASSALCSAVPVRRKAKQHHCRTCGKTFSSSSALQIHNRTHTGEKPFACNVCLRAFTTKGNLKVHMGTHVWNSASTRKGRRLFTNGSLVPLASSPVILPALPQMNPVTPPSKLGESVYSRNQYTDPLPLARGVRTNDISAVQRKEVCYLSGPTGLKERPPVGDLGVTLDKLL